MAEDLASKLREAFKHKRYGGGDDFDLLDVAAAALDHQKIEIDYLRGDRDAWRTCAQNAGLHPTERNG